VEDSGRRGIGGLMTFTGSIAPSPTLVRPYPTVSSPPIARPPLPSTFPGPPDSDQGSPKTSEMFPRPEDSDQGFSRPSMFPRPPESDRGSSRPSSMISGPPDSDRGSTRTPLMFPGLPDSGQGSSRPFLTFPGPPESGRSSARPRGLLMSDICETMSRIRSSLHSAGAGHFDSLSVVYYFTGAVLREDRGPGVAPSYMCGPSLPPK